MTRLPLGLRNLRCPNQKVDCPFMARVSGHTAAECEGANREALGGGEDSPVIDLIIAD
jgi:hypothetical protein